MAISLETAAQLRRLTLLTESLCKLPAYPSPRWCEQAGERLLRWLEGPLVACVTIGRIESDGLIAARESAGVAAEGVAPERLERLRRDVLHGAPAAPSLGDPLDWNGARIAMRRSDGRDIPSLNGSMAGLGAGEELVGGVPIDPLNPRRIILVELSPVGEERHWRSELMDMLAAGLEPLARRAALAFGAGEGPGVAPLTQREEDVLASLTCGKSVREIAFELKRSPHTVHDHVKSLHRKLRASSRGELIARALGRLGAS